MTPSRPPPVCNALWMGSALGPLERACLASFVEVGHRVDLYGYDEVEGVPAGVSVRDAAEVLPRSSMLRHRATGSWSLGSNRFRYALMRAGRGVWIDCDLLCVRPLPDEPFLFAYENAERINGAVLRIPCDHPVLDDLEAIFDSPTWTPPFESRGRRITYAIRRLVRRDFGIADMPWGVAGPRALTHYLPRHGLAHLARAADAFYPVSLRDADLLLAPDPSALAARIGERTLCLHLWGQALRQQADPPPPTSFLAAVHDGSWRELLPIPRATASAAR